MAVARMRTLNEAHAELMAADPGCCLTKSALRRLVVSGAVPSVKIGAKYLINFDRLQEYFEECTAIAPQNPKLGTIRRASNF